MPERYGESEFGCGNPLPLNFLELESRTRLDNGLVWNRIRNW